MGTLVGQVVMMLLGPRRHVAARRRRPIRWKQKPLDVHKRRVTYDNSTWNMVGEEGNGWRPEAHRPDKKCAEQCTTKGKRSHYASLY